MSKTVTFTCDRCGREADEYRTDWAYVGVRSDGWSVEYDLCPACRDAVLADMSAHRRVAS